ncbi:MAG: ATP-binding cassette domain-containing protein [Deltaproteobacteria bacterium]|nr:ATP-binding cassette domain-containing protein [Deltaproteobacteria bacterium]
MSLLRGETTVIVGPSGTGKSTLIKLLVGLLKPDAGTVLVDGQDVGKLGRAELMRLRRKFGMLFQDGALFHGMTVAQNVAFPLRHHLALKREEEERRVEVALQQVGLPGLGRRRPDELSGGQRKRVGLARALVMEPMIVLFDEPTSGLDPVTSAAIDELIVDTRKRLGLTFVVITHDVQSCVHIADRVGMLWEGRLRAWGPLAEVTASTDPVVRQFFDRRSDGPIKVV